MTHGRPGSYNAGCRCPSCREAWRAYHRQWARERARGKRRMVNAKDTRAHVTALRKAGMTYQQIATGADVQINTVWKIANGTTKIVRKSTHHAILGVAIDDRAKDLPRPAKDALPLLDALNRAGLRDADIRRIARVRPDQVRRRRYVYASTYARLELTCRLLAREGLIDATVLP